VTVLRPVQRYDHVVVSAVAHLDAPERVTSAELEDQLAGTMARIGLPAGTLEALSGIEERRFWEVGATPSAVASAAAAKLLAQVDVDPSEIGVLVNTSVDRDYVEPSTACIVHANLGLAPEAQNFDVGNACLGFLNGMALVAGMIERGDVDHGLVVDGEGSRFVTEATIARLADPGCDRQTFRESFATLTLGSGAAAMLLSRAEVADGGHPFRGFISRAATQHHGLCRGQVDDMRTDTRRLLAAGIVLAREAYKEAVDAFDLSNEAVALYVMHQVSKVHARQVVETLGLEPDKVPLLYPRFGNIGPAGMVITLSKAVEAGGLAPGDRVALMGVGSGLNAAMADVCW
jgi:3-oxoacyl-[acyl-carrier-protein] synthase-3